MRTYLPQVKGRPAFVTEVKDLFGGGTKVLDRESGKVECIVSVTGIKDTVDDVIEPGAYRKTISTRRPKGVRSHDWDRFACKALAYEELLPGDQQLPARTGAGEPWPRAAGAVKVLAQYNLDTKDGSEGLSNVAFLGDEQEWSVGYNVERGHARMVKGVRHIDVMTEWFEFSDVLWGAMPLARGAELKSLGGMAARGGLWLPEGTVKALPGSYQERDNLLHTALQAELRSEVGETEGGDVRGWVNVVGTWDDRVVACFYSHADEAPRHYEYDYRITGDDVELTDRRPVEVVETLQPADEEPDAAADVVEEKEEPALTATDLAAQAALYDEFTR